MSNRRLTFVGVVVALLLAGVVSFYSSGSPDGLERVAEDGGFSSTSEDSPAADSPLADYSVRGVDDSRLSGGVAGVVGTLVVLVLAGGLAFALRRREPSEPPTESSDRDRADVD